MDRTKSKRDMTAADLTFGDPFSAAAVPERPIGRLVDAVDITSPDRTQCPPGMTSSRRLLRTGRSTEPTPKARQTPRTVDRWRPVPCYPGRRSGEHVSSVDDRAELVFSVARPLPRWANRLAFPCCPVLLQKVDVVRTASVAASSEPFPAGVGLFPRTRWTADSGYERPPECGRSRIDCWRAARRWRRARAVRISQILADCLLLPSYCSAFSGTGM